ncbi:MAG: DDE-type integrase/transposase/recombinase, partial [Pseudomonadales bacterium]|nr:DDE-type integrase/transposase/recombinase [Pseudomonadales bacterium]
MDKELQHQLKKGNLVERNGLLYHPSPRGEQLAVPGQAMRLAIIKEAHDPPYAGHFGADKTIDLVGRSYWWPGMSTHIHHYVLNCDVCQRDKSRTGKIPGELQPLPIPDDRWNSVSMDFIVELPCTKRGHDAIWVVVDRFSKMVHMAPTTSKVTAADTAQMFFERVFAAHGLPKEVISDRGPQFSGHFWRQLCSRFSIKPALSTAFHPQTDGQTERMNRVIEDTLCHFVGPRQDEWDELLPYVEFAINNSKAAVTGHTPFFLNYGRHPITPLTWHLPAAA